VSIRSWQASASHQVELEGKVWPVVTQEDLIKALVDGAVVLDRAGGCLQVVLQRVPTGVPNEYLTVAGLVVWMDRTNAKPQPEARGLEIVDGEAIGNGEHGELGEDELAAVVAATDAPAPGETRTYPADEAPAEPPPEAPEVDESAVPEALRSG
jgi:hypothetical protein